VVSRGWLLHVQQASAFPFGERRARADCPHNPLGPISTHDFIALPGQKSSVILGRACGAPIEKADVARTVVAASTAVAVGLTFAG